MVEQLAEPGKLIRENIYPKTNDQFIEMAAKIGYCICKDAIWHEDTCNWISSSNELEVDYPKPYFKAMSGDFYSGTTGVAYALAILYEATGEKLFKRTALGAINQAIQNLESVAEPSRLGFHIGWVGTAFACLELAQYIKDDNLEMQALAIFEKIKGIDIRKSGIDIIGGIAGSIPVLKKMHHKNPQLNLSDHIMNAGDHLIEIAEKQPIGYSWNTMADLEHYLTGFAHGVSGIVNALMEIYEFTNDGKYLDAAHEGLKYENYHFKKDVQNWPDFRVDEKQKQGSSKDYPCSSAWCHGAPGIALTRLRAYQVTGNKVIRHEAEVALNTTLKNLVLASNQNFSLCHGLAGNADILIEASNILNDKIYFEKALEAGEFGIETFGKCNTWINGSNNHFHLPDFMLGHSGIAYFYLRLSEPNKYASVLY